MSEFCYILDNEKGTRLFLSNEGPQEQYDDRADEYMTDGFRHVEDRCIGTCVLHVFERDTPATDIVGSERGALSRL